MHSVSQLAWEDKSISKRLELGALDRHGAASRLIRFDQAATDQIGDITLYSSHQASGYSIGNCDPIIDRQASQLGPEGLGSRRVSMPSLWMRFASAEATHTGRLPSRAWLGFTESGFPRLR